MHEGGRKAAAAGAAGRGGRGLASRRPVGFRMYVPGPSPHALVQQVTPKAGRWGLGHAGPAAAAPGEPGSLPALGGGGRRPGPDAGAPLPRNPWGRGCGGGATCTAWSLTIPFGRLSFPSGSDSGLEMPGPGRAASWEERVINSLALTQIDDSI